MKTGKDILNNFLNCDSRGGLSVNVFRPVCTPAVTSLGFLVEEEVGLVFKVFGLAIKQFYILRI